VVYFDVDHSDTEGNSLVDSFERIEIGHRPMCEFEHEMVRVQGVEKTEQLFPAALLNRLAAVVAETEMHRPLSAAVDRIEYEVHRFGCERAIRWISWDVRFVNL
jgi:hypothetical protein